MVPEEDRCEIVEWYNGRSVFLTGGSGFMGKVLVEKMLYSCTGVKNLYILMRQKRGRTPQQRIEDMWKLPLFERLRTSQPDAINKIKPIVGDLNTDGMNMCESDRQLLVDHVSVVFHIAATLRLEAKLREAVEQNTTGTARVLDLAKEIKQLKVFVHYSTAFCSADIDVFNEKLYQCKDNPRDVIDVCKWINDEALEAATPALIAPHPNTYTYTKRLAETLVASEGEAHNLPVCIIRPSIVTPTWKEPFPGWVDTLNGPMGIIVGAGKGVIRSVLCNGKNDAHVVPVDCAIFATLIIAQQIGSAKEKPKELPVYNLTQDGVMKVTWGEVLDKGRDIGREYPFEMQIWYPDGDLRTSKFTHLLFCIFFHWLPAYFIDFLMIIFMQKTFMVRIAKKIHTGLELLQFFTMRQWVFKSDNLMKLCNELTPADKKIFPLDFENISMEDYLKTAILGTRQYCVKEDLSSLPRCRLQQKVLYVVHKTCVYGFYYLALSYLMNSTSTTKEIFDYTKSYVQYIPIIGSFFGSTV